MLRFLVTEDRLAPASAIVVLGGEPPYREMEAASLYRAGWAQRVFIVPNANEAIREDAYRTLGLSLPAEWELRRDALIALGVPASAIVVAKRASLATLDELEIANAEVASEVEPVILVTSNYHTRRVSLYWKRVAGPKRRGIVRAAPDDRIVGKVWWRRQTPAKKVLNEYLGLLNYLVGFPVARRAFSNSSARRDSTAS